MIKVYSPIFLKYHAEKLCETLSELGYESEWTNDIGDDDSLYIMYCAYQRHTPKNYIVYQVEQWGSYWFNSHYWDMLKGAKQVWEFAENNVSKYSKEYESKVFYVPAGLINGKNHVKHIDVLFYGALNKHRIELLNDIRACGINITVKENVYGEEMINILAQTKIVLNLHFYQKGHLETFRVNESLSCGCKVVSERNHFAHYPDIYREFVYFGTTPKEIAFSIKKALQNQNTKDLSPLSNKEQVAKAISAYFS